MLDAARDVRAAIDKVAEKDERVSCCIAWKKVEQRAKLRATAMNITNDKCFHSEVFRGTDFSLCSVTWIHRLKSVLLISRRLATLGR